jgi:hypothetical protein
MSTEAILAAAYSGALIAVAFVLESLSALTHRRSLRYRTAGFTYHRALDTWKCPEGQHLWRHEVDESLRVIRYRGKAQVCNACARKGDCTDSDRGREIVRPLDPWPRSEAGRFHRGISLVVVLLANLILLVAMVRHHDGIELVVLGGLLALGLLSAHRLTRDFVAHPARFPA